MNPYIVYDDSIGPQEGAAMVFAHTAREARKVGYPECRDWHGTAWIDCRARRLPSEPHLMEQAVSDQPHIVHNPKTCERCGFWGGKPLEGGGCEFCDAEDY